MQQGLFWYWLPLNVTCESKWQAQNYVFFIKRHFYVYFIEIFF